MPKTEPPRPVRCQNNSSSIPVKAPEVPVPGAGFQKKRTDPGGMGPNRKRSRKFDPNWYFVWILRSWKRACFASGDSLALWPLIPWKRCRNSMAWIRGGVSPVSRSLATECGGVRTGLSVTVPKRWREAVERCPIISVVEGSAAGPRSCSVLRRFDEGPTDDPKRRHLERICGMPVRFVARGPDRGRRFRFACQIADHDFTKRTGSE